jgi:hypothetical protein
LVGCHKTLDLDILKAQFLLLIFHKETPANIKKERVIVWHFVRTIRTNGAGARAETPRKFTPPTLDISK